MLRAARDCDDAAAGYPRQAGAFDAAAMRAAGELSGGRRGGSVCIGVASAKRYVRMRRSRNAAATDRPASSGCHPSAVPVESERLACSAAAITRADAAAVEAGSRRSALRCLPSSLSPLPHAARPPVRPAHGR